MLTSIIPEWTTTLLLPFSTAFLYAFSLILFLLPGFAISAVIASRRELRAIDSVILSISSSAVLGYVAFWVYLLSKVLGEIFSYTVVFSSVLTLALTLWRVRGLKNLGKQIARPFAYVLVVGIFYSYLFFLFTNPLKAPFELANFRFFQEVRPGDNLIPLFFAEKIYDRQPVSPVCCGDWLSSDRPPLQVGIFLLQRPIRFFGNTGLQYLLLAIALQCLWLAGVCSVLWVLQASTLYTQQVLGFLVFSGFFFYNSVYTWPKLLAATFILFAVSLLLGASEKSKLTMLETVLIAVCFSLALLAHSGAIFSTPGFLLLFLMKRLRVSWQACACALLLITFFLLPWMAYQRFYDPPGNRLLKMHLADAGEIDSRSTWQAIHEAYASRTVMTLLSYKWANLRTMFGPDPGAGFGVAEVVAATESRSGGLENSRIAQREYIWNAIGVLNAGWLTFLACLVRRKKFNTLGGARLLLAAAALNLTVWCIVLFGPGQTFVAHSSYADIILLSLGLLSFLLTYIRRAVFLLWILQLVNFAIVWAGVKPTPLTPAQTPTFSPVLQWPLLIAGLICGIGLLWHFGQSYRTSLPAR